MWQSVKVSHVFSTLTLKQIFWKAKTFFKKMGYAFLVETTKIENTWFPFKTALSEANVKTNSMATTKWTYHKEWSFVSNYFFFWKICSSLRTSCKESIWCINDPIVNIGIFRKRRSLILGCFFPVSILNSCNKQHGGRDETACIFASGRTWVPTREEKTICGLVERNYVLFYLVKVLRDGNHARFELLIKIF